MAIDDYLCPTIIVPQKSIYYFLMKAFITSCALSLGLASLPLAAQQDVSHVRPCFTHELQTMHTWQDRAYGESVQRVFDEAKHRSQLRDDDTTVYRIPVVVHVLYNTPAENLSDAVVQSQIAKLNEDYRRQNADAAQTRDVFLDRVADTRIEFYLAYLDPNGNQTNGITHTETTQASFSPFGDIGSALEDLGLTPEQIQCLMEAVSTGDINSALACGVSLEVLLQLVEIFTSGGGGNMDAMKDPATGGVAAWDTDRYLNIWVCDLNGENPAVGLLLGFAYPPADLPNWPAGSNGTAATDGVVIDYLSFGNNTPNTTPLQPFADDGRTAVHEVGHYLGLRHIWGDGDCTQDDGIDDTPDADAQTDATAGCDPSQNTCTEATDPQLPDMYENYMDYSSDECQNLFTRQQADLMRSVLTGPRAGLLWQNTVGIESPAIDMPQVSAQPNPTQGTLRVSWKGNVPPSNLSVYNAAGVCVATVQPTGMTSEIDLSQQPQGVYILKATTGTQHQIVKIVKQ